jgi:leader peptidase (prepilin peptidase)/N-methyltransferase
MFAIAWFTGGFGGGDIKLMAAAGLYLGTADIVLAFLVGACLGAVYGLFMVLRKKAGRKSAIAFGPFLSAGIVISLLSGGRIIDWYLGMFRW